MRQDKSAALARSAELLATQERQRQLEQQLEQAQAAYAASEQRYAALVRQSREAEAVLRAERDLLNAVMNTSVAAIVVLDAQGAIIFANDRAEQVLGLSKADITQLTYDAPEWQPSGLDGEPWPDEQQPFRRVMKTGGPVFDIRHGIVWPDGTRRCLSINGAPLRDERGAIDRVVFSVSDITASHRAEAALRLNEERYRVVSEMASDYAYCFRIDETGAMTPEWVTDSFSRITGHDRKAINGPADWMAMIHPDDLPLAMRDGELLVRGRPTVNELRIVTPDGKVRWLRHYNRPVWSEGLGRVVQVYGAAQDVTERKQLEEQLAQVQKLEAVGRLAGGIAHDFNNFLTVILGNCELALASIDERHPLYHEINHTHNVAERASALTRQLLAFSRRQVLKTQRVNLNRVVADSELLLRRLLGPSVTLALGLDPALADVYADPSQLEQVIINLTVNARDAMPHGGSLLVETTNLTVAPSGQGAQLERPGAYVLLRVSDTGCGIDPATQARVFEPFFTTKEPGKGTGLGLATVHGIVSQSGGYIRLCSEPGRGTAFEILLPTQTGADLRLTADER